MSGRAPRHVDRTTAGESLSRSATAGPSTGAGLDLPGRSASVPPVPVEVPRFQRIRLEKVSARQKNRVKHVDGWEVLVPTKGALSLLAAALPGTQRTQCKLCPLGAIYPTAELAARAADRALIALSGRLAAEALLNWPLVEYPAGDCHQLFGERLARYMIRIVDEGQEEMDAARGRLARSTARGGEAADGGGDVDGDGDGEEVRGRHSAGTRPRKRRGKAAAVRPAKVLRWLMEPTEVSVPFYSVFCTKQRQRRATELVERMKKHAAGVKQAVVASTKKNSWEVPMGAFPPRGHQFDDILASRRLAESASAELIESHADDREPISSANRRCRWCGGRHHGSRSLTQCPLLQMALAVEESVDPACTRCKDAPEASCRACLRGSAGLPPEVMSLNVPLRQDAVRIGWAERLSPAMLDLANSMQRIANAAVSEFGAEHLTAQLTPDALLALAVIAETAIEDALERARRVGGNDVD